jgi:hypothetical protein
MFTYRSKPHPYYLETQAHLRGEALSPLEAMGLLIGQMILTQVKIFPSIMGTKQAVQTSGCRLGKRALLFIFFYYLGIILLFVYFVYYLGIPQKYRSIEV